MGSSTISQKQKLQEALRVRLSIVHELIMQCDLVIGGRGGGFVPLSADVQSVISALPIAVHCFCTVARKFREMQNMHNRTGTPTPHTHTRTLARRALPVCSRGTVFTCSVHGYDHCI